MADEKPKNVRTSTLLVVIIVITSLIAGGLFGYFSCFSATSNEIGNLQNQLTALQEQIGNFQPTQNIDYQNATVISGENGSVSQLYEQVEESVVVIRGMIIAQYDRFGRPTTLKFKGLVSSTTSRDRL